MSYKAKNGPSWAEEGARRTSGSAPVQQTTGAAQHVKAHVGRVRRTVVSHSQPTI